MKYSNIVLHSLCIVDVISAFYILTNRYDLGETWFGEGGGGLSFGS